MNDEDQAERVCMCGGPIVNGECQDRVHAESASDPVPAAEGPAPVLSGTFAIFEDGRGGYVLFTDTGDGPQRKDIPAALVRMATGGGMLGKRLAGIFG